MSERVDNKKRRSVKTSIVSAAIAMCSLLPPCLLIFQLIRDILPESHGALERWGQSLAVWLLVMGLFGLLVKVVDKIANEIELLGVSKALFSCVGKAAAFAVLLIVWFGIVKRISTFKVFKLHATSLTLGMIVLLLAGSLALGINMWKKSANSE